MDPERHEEDLAKKRKAWEKVNKAPRTKKNIMEDMIIYVDKGMLGQENGPRVLK